MTKVEILAELPKLRAEDRRQLFVSLCELEEEDLLRGEGLAEREKRALDEALAAFEKDQDRGTPWREAIQRIRSAGRP